MDLSEIYKEYIPEDIEKQMKELYDLAYKSRSFITTKSEALPELIVDGFDAEQIWQQIELANNEVFSERNLESIAKLLANKEPLVFPFETNSNEEVDKEEETENEEQSQKSEYSDGEEDDKLEQSSDDNSLNENDKRKAKKVSGTKRKKRRTTEVDDKFFKLDELDEYLKIEDRKEMKAKNKSHSDSSDEEEELIDLFNDFSDQDDNDDNDEGDYDEDSNEIQNGKSMKYADFFDSPESDAEQQGRDEDTGNEEDDIDDDGAREENEHAFNDENNDMNEYKMDHHSDKKKKVKFNLLDNSDDSDSKEENSHDQTNKGEVKSSLEARQERLQKKIAELEKEAVSEKPWQLKGESSVFNRPKDSLLEEYVEFDTGSRPAPIMTEKTTMKLEDIIRSRIKDKAWDDVEKKVKPVETPLEFKKKLVMNQEKSKESLAQIYENEYVKQREALTTEDKDEQEKEDPPEHIEIKERIHSLFRKLDALSNFHYTPKPAKPDIKIISNMPAVNMEEVAPVTTSDATLLAPEEVKSKQKGDLIGKSERTKTDKKRERRKKKLKQHVHAVNLVKNSKDDNKNKKSKDPAVKVTGRNVIKDQSNADKKAIKSSTAFFAQLQDEVKSGILSKTKELASKKKKVTKTAVRLKL